MILGLGCSQPFEALFLRRFGLLREDIPGNTNAEDQYQEKRIKKDRLLSSRIRLAAGQYELTTPMIENPASGQTLTPKD